MNFEVIVTSILHSIRTIEAVRFIHKIRKHKMGKENTNINFDEDTIVANFRLLTAAKRRSFLRKIARVTFHENGKEAVNTILDAIKSVCENAKK